MSNVEAPHATIYVSIVGGQMSVHCDDRGIGIPGMVFAVEMLKVRWITGNTQEGKATFVAKAVPGFNPRKVP